MNRIFHRYIARGFWGPFGFGLAVFCLLLLFGTLFDKLSDFMSRGAGPGLFARYLLYQAPYFIVKMVPMATLLAVLSSLGGMMASGEWKAGMAGGWRPFDMLKPLLACSLLAGAGQFLLQETVAPGFYMRSKSLLAEEVRGHTDWQNLLKSDVAFSAGKETFVTARSFDGHSGVMRGVIVNTYREGRLWRELNADSGYWLPGTGRWEFRDGVLMEYGAVGKPSFTRFASYPSEISADPKNLLLEKLVPDGVSISGLLRRLRLLEDAGSPSTEERTLLWVKLAAPLANPAMALIGAVMVLLSKQSSRSTSFGASVALGFFFWAVIIMTQEAGNAGLFPPLVAGLAPAALFVAVSLWGLRRARAI